MMDVEIMTGRWTPPTGNYGGTWRVEEDINEGLYERAPEDSAVVVRGASEDEVRAGLAALDLLRSQWRIDPYNVFPGEAWTMSAERHQSSYGWASADADTLAAAVLALAAEIEDAA